MTISETESTPLREIAYHRLREDILACRLLPGQRITERQIVTETGLGISAVREALTRLDHEGLVHTQPRRGYQVTPLTIKAVDDLFDFWHILGPEVVRRGVTGATQEQLDHVIAGFQRMVELDSAGAPSRDLTQRWLELADGTFATLAEATANHYLIDACRRLAGEMRRVWSLLIDRDLMFMVAHERTAGWGEALGRRDGEAAAALAHEYIQHSHNRVLRILARWPSVITAEIQPLAGLAIRHAPVQGVPTANTGTDVR